MSAARDRQGRGRARAGSVQAGVGEAAQEVQGGGVYPDQGGGWAAHAVLQQLPSAVLLTRTTCSCSAATMTIRSKSPPIRAAASPATGGPTVYPSKRSHGPTRL